MKTLLPLLFLAALAGAQTQLSFTKDGGNGCFHYRVGGWKCVAKRRELIFGKLDDGFGNHCALGAFWEDNPKRTLHSSLVDEVAAVNDSVPPTATPKERWKKVNSWLRFKIASLTAKRRTP